MVIYTTETKGKKETSLHQTIIYVGLDVDATQYHGSALDKKSGEVIDFKCRPTLKGLLGQLEKLGRHFPGCVFRLCYEASYIGYTLQRDLAEKGDHCDVVAPTSMPKLRGKYEQQVEVLAKSQRYEKPVQALTCYKRHRPKGSGQRGSSLSRWRIQSQQSASRLPRGTTLGQRRGHNEGLFLPTMYCESRFESFIMCLTLQPMSPNTCYLCPRSIHRG